MGCCKTKPQQSYSPTERVPTSPSIDCTASTLKSYRLSVEEGKSEDSGDKDKSDRSNEKDEKKEEQQETKPTGENKKGGSDSKNRASPKVASPRPIIKDIAKKIEQRVEDRQSRVAGGKVRREVIAAPSRPPMSSGHSSGRGSGRGHGVRAGGPQRSYFPPGYKSRRGKRGGMSGAGSMRPPTIKTPPPSKKKRPSSSSASRKRSKILKATRSSRKKSSEAKASRSSGKKSREVKASRSSRSSRRSSRKKSLSNAASLMKQMTKIAKAKTTGKKPHVKCPKCGKHLQAKNKVVEEHRDVCPGNALKKWRPRKLRKSLKEMRKRSSAEGAVSRSSGGPSRRRKEEGGGSSRTTRSSGGGQGAASRRRKEEQSGKSLMVCPRCKESIPSGVTVDKHLEECREKMHEEEDSRRPTVNRPPDSKKETTDQTLPEGKWDGDKGREIVLEEESEVIREEKSELSDKVLPEGKVDRVIQEGKSDKVVREEKSDKVAHAGESRRHADVAPLPEQVRHDPGISGSTHEACRIQQGRQGLPAQQPFPPGIDFCLKVGEDPWNKQRREIRVGFPDNEDTMTVDIIKSHLPDEEVYVQMDDADIGRGATWKQKSSDVRSPTHAMDMMSSADIAAISAGGSQRRAPPTHFYSQEGRPELPSGSAQSEKATPKGWCNCF